MAHRIEENDLLIHPVGSREAQTSLLSPIPELHGPRFLLKHLSCLPCNICVNSKPALLILVWCVVVGAVYLSLLTGLSAVGFALENNLRNHYNSSLNLVVCSVIVAYAMLALVLLLYPLSGFLADIYCGRYRTVTFSLILLWAAMVSLCCTLIIAIKVHFDHIRPVAVPFGLFACMAVLLVIVGLAGYQANVIQLGLDQLLEAPSEKLGLFVHWLMWAYSLGNFIILIVFVFLPCYINDPSIKKHVNKTFASIPFIFFFILTVLLAFTCYNHSWFYSEPGQNNPYKTVFQVLNFARKNKYPLCRSAFTFCDDVRPSRIDFAKERFGGPFTSPQVEDVKTLLRIVLVLIALGPLFILELPVSFPLFPLFTLHTGKEYQFYGNNMSCSSPAKWVIIQSGSMGYIFSIMFLPFYMWIVYSFLRKRVPKILNRLLLSVATSLAGVVCLLIVDLIGHFHYRRQHLLTNSTDNLCLFTSPFRYTRHTRPTLLGMHWSINIAPCILLNIGSLLTTATTFEFISAQSPHSMKGLLVGVFFAIKGLFQFISAAAVVPFAIPNIWNHINSVTNCGFGYYLFTIVVASIGLVVFSVVVRSYRYRQRDERPYDTRFAEQYYEGIINNPHRAAASVVYSPSDEFLYRNELGVTCSNDYGSRREHCQTLTITLPNK